MNAIPSPAVERQILRRCFPAAPSRPCQSLRRQLRARFRVLPPGGRLRGGVPAARRARPASSATATRTTISPSRTWTVAMPRRARRRACSTSHSRWRPKSIWSRATVRRWRRVSSSPSARTMTSPTRSTSTTPTATWWRSTPTCSRTGARREAASSRARSRTGFPAKPPCRWRNPATRRIRNCVRSPIRCSGVAASRTSAWWRRSTRRCWPTTPAISDCNRSPGRQVATGCCWAVPQAIRSSPCTEPGQGLVRGFHHVGVEVGSEADLDRALALLPRDGVEVERHIEHPARRAITILDPDGIRLQFYVEPRLERAASCWRCAAGRASPALSRCVDANSGRAHA